MKPGHWRRATGHETLTTACQRQGDRRRWPAPAASARECWNRAWLTIAWAWSSRPALAMVTPRHACSRRMGNRQLEGRRSVAVLTPRCLL